MGFWGGLKKLGKGVGKGAQIGLSVAAIVDPRLQPVVAVIGAAIQRAERGAATGQDKAVLASQIVTDASPAIIAALEQTFGKELLNEDLLADGLRDIQEGTVKLLNAFGAMPK